MAHKIEISDKTYEDLKEFCGLNDLKIGQYADKLIRDGLMIEMYGDVPFTNYKRPAQDPVEVVKTVLVKLKELENPEAEAEIMDSGDIMFGNQENNEQIGTISAPDTEDYASELKKTQEVVLKESGVPDKVINKITKRRLK